MTRNQALLVKFLRIRLGCSWGKLYSHWYNRYVIKVPFTNIEFHASSFYGRELCRMAQDILNENWEDEC